MKNKISAKECFRNYRFHSIFWKNILLVFSVILLPFICVLLISTYTYDELQTNETRTYSKELLTRSTMDVDNLFKELISRFRRCSARSAHDVVSLTEAEVEAEKRLQTVPSVYSGPDDDENWKIARHRIAVEHVLTKTALSEQSRQIYRELLATGDNCAEVARRLNLPAATVRQVKSRVSRMIAAFEKMIG